MTLVAGRGLMVRSAIPYRAVVSTLFANLTYLAHPHLARVVSHDFAQVLLSRIFRCRLENL